MNKQSIINTSNFEYIDLPINMPMLIEQFHNATKSYPPLMINETFGGWSVTSSNGSYLDGWLTKKPDFNAVAKSIEELRKTNEEIGFKGPKLYRIPTELCYGEVNRIITFLNEEGFYPCRCRYSLLKSGGTTTMHRDYPDWLYGVRLHIPIITNDQCFFEYENEKRHIPADGRAVLVKVNIMHRAYNNGSTDRIHFICDFFDTKQKTTFNKYTREDSLKLMSKSD